MWCRALLAAVAVSCTFTTVQANDPTQIKDILCVLILNGLQKEDFDVSTLRKLQRHNVNIEDMNNEAMRKECEVVNKSSRIINADLNETVTLKDGPYIGDKREDQRTKLNDSNLFNTITNYFSYAKPNNRGKVSNDDVEKFINVWNMITRTKEYVVESTTKAIEISTFFMSRTATNRRSNEKLEYINKILENYIDNQKITTTSRPTTNIVDYDLIAKKIKEILSNDNQNTQKPLQTVHAAEENLRRYFVNKEPLHNASIQSTREILKLNNKTDSKNIRIGEKDTNYQGKKRFLLDDIGPINMETAKEDTKYKSNAKKEINTLSEDIIRELSESVRAKILQDLKKIISTTTATMKSTAITKSTTVRKTTTVKPTETTTINSKREHKERTVTDVLEKFMEIFQQFQTNKEITTKNVVSGHTNIKTEDKTHTVNVNIKPVPVNITSVIINPYGSMHAPVIQTAVMPNGHYNLMNIHTPLQNIAPFKSEHKITQLNIYNTKNTIRTSPITIQTNSIEVHPLGLPAQQSFVYQNIVVTTKRPFEKVFYDFPNYNSQVNEYDDRKFDERKYKHQNVEYPRSGRVNYYKEFGIGKPERSREFINDEYTKERNKRKPIKYKEYGPSDYNDRNVERFHEKLERADNWPRNPRDRSRESWNIDDNIYSKPKLISRQQLPINSAKKRSRYDEAHFKNFMKTQQKVNDMLERILATKTNSNNPRSVETTV